jgi:hypothetical protein
MAPLGSVEHQLLRPVESYIPSGLHQKGAIGAEPKDDDHALFRVSACAVGIV